MTSDRSLDDLIQEYLADPEGYETNKNLGLKMLKINNLFEPAEKHIRKALSFNRDEPARLHLLHGLASAFEFKGNYDGAIQIYTQLFNLNPDTVMYLVNLGDAYFRAGKLALASDVFRIVLTTHYEVAKRHAIRRNGPITQLLFPAHVACSRFGELAGKIDIYVKARILGMTPEVDAVFLARPELVVNPALLGYWRKSVGRFVTFIADERERREIEKTHGKEVLYMDYYNVPDGRALDRILAYLIVQRRWEEENRPPLLTLSRDHVERGRRNMQTLGMPDDAWFVSLHVRESGAYGENIPWDHNTLRNARIEDYFEAIEAITSRGGWVVRIGDPSMKPLPPMERVIDYVHTDVHEDWMDLFCCSQCRFLIGTCSGPDSVAFTFGVPVVGTNWFPMGFWPNSTKDLFVHKLLRRREDGRFLDIREAVEPPLAGMHWPKFYDDRGLEVLDNTAGDITGAVLEMLDRLDGDFEYSAQDQALQARYATMADFADVPINARVPMDFLRRHPFLVGDG